MKVKEIGSGLTELLLNRFGHDTRSPGLHASQIWTDIAASIGKSSKSPLSQDKLQEFGTLGFVWERIIENTLASLYYDETRHFRPGEQTLDGIHFTPDYVDLDFYGDESYELGVEEWKVKWCSCNKADDLERNFWVWIVQMKAYCYVLNTRLARLRALFIVGNWRDDITPKIREFEFEFSQQELIDNHRMLLNHAKRKGWVK